MKLFEDTYIDPKSLISKLEDGENDIKLYVREPLFCGISSQLSLDLYRVTCVEFIGCFLWNTKPQDESVVRSCLDMELGGGSNLKGYYCRVSTPDAEVFLACKEIKLNSPVIENTLDSSYVSEGEDSVIFEEMKLNREKF